MILLMESLNADIVGYLIRFIRRDKDKCRLLMTCQWISKCEVFFHEDILINKIIRSRWFHKFTNIIVKNKKCKFPRKGLTPPLKASGFPSSITSLTFNHEFNDSVKDYIPSTIVYLKFSDDFNQPIEGCIPPSVKNLNFGWSFDQPIRNCIPHSVKYLSFGYRFNQSIKYCIPLGVNFLHFGERFNQPIKGCIPSSVTRLGLDISFRHPVDIPSSVVELMLYEYSDNLMRTIPTTVKKIIFVRRITMRQKIRAKRHLPNSKIMDIYDINGYYSDKKNYFC